MIIRSDVPLAPLTTFHIGGTASHFATAHTEDEIRDAVTYAQTHELPLSLIGGGSNLLISDAGVKGLVIQPAFFTEIHRRHDGVATAGAGVSWDSLVIWSVEQKLTGIECLSGIPGTVGAASVQNIGAYGQQISDVINFVRVVDLVDGSTRELSASDCRFSYRTSIFNTTSRGRYCITSLGLNLTTGDATVARVRETVLDIRSRKGMLSTSHNSAGSFFKNPFISSSAVPPKAPQWPQPDGTTKVAAAWLIEHAGIAKGFSIGKAMVSPDHALCIINADDATSSDIVALASFIQKRVFSTFSIHLKPEVQLWGFDEHLLVD